MSIASLVGLHVSSLNFCLLSVMHLFSTTRQYQGELGIPSKNCY
jgi:hypothetical protein